MLVEYGVMLRNQKKRTHSAGLSAGAFTTKQSKSFYITPNILTYLQYESSKTFTVSLESYP